MLFKATLSGIIVISSILFTNQASANPAIISSITSPNLITEMQTLSKEEQKQTACMALAVHHEAGNQSETGQRAIVHVILNRMADKRFANTACGVLFQPGQFSFVRHSARNITPKSGARWDAIVRLVRSVQAGESKDPTHGALFFYNPHSGRPALPHVRLSTRIGAHVFVKA